MTTPIDDNQRVLIVGGGLAGLAAATAISKHGLPVTLFESRPRLGGRATSFDDKSTGDLVDNCQHVGMGCCTNLQAFCDDIGISTHFRVERELTFIDRQGRSSRFAPNRLPAPLHLASALMGLRYFSWGEKWTIARGLSQLAAERRYNGPMHTWLVHQGQPERVRKLFWHIVLVSALSDTLDRVSTQAARKVFVDGFFRNRTAWEVHLPDAPLDDLYGPPVLKTLAARGADVRLNTGVERIDICSSKGVVATRTGEHVTGDAVILAVSHHRVRSLLPESMHEEPFVRAADSLEPAPIASVHLWFDRPITDLPHAVFIDHLSQWMFRRPSQRPGLHYYQVVISASYDLDGRPREDVIEQVRAELAVAFPDAKDAVIEHARVVMEKRAVFSPTPASCNSRPPQQTCRERLFLAGDWTDTGWPATMEGAVRSGYLAAERVLARHGVTTSLLAPEPKAARLTRLLRMT